MNRLMLCMLAAASIQPALAADGDVARVARGKYLVTTSGCNDCHMPTLPPGPWIAAASHTNTAHFGPWGVSFTANLTPDPETGLGKWSLATFSQTIRTGRHMGRGRKILPPMPIPMYRNFNDEDLAAIYAYLQSIPPIRNRVPEPLPPVVAARQAAR